MIDVHQNATLSEFFEGDRSRVIGNRCNPVLQLVDFIQTASANKHISGNIYHTDIRKVSSELTLCRF